MLIDKGADSKAIVNGISAESLIEEIFNEDERNYIYNVNRSTCRL
jgi:hypothetical protein